MDIKNKTAVVLGGYGLVGMSVCHQLLALSPKRLVVASLRRKEALEAVEALKRAHPDSPTRILPAWGDVLLRAEWQRDDTHPRPVVLADPQKRRQLVTDVLDELTDEIVEASMLAQIILGTAPGLDGVPAQIVVDCINIATAVAYQNIYATARHFMALGNDPQPVVDWPEEVERLLSSIYIPQLVRHMQIYQEAMRRAGTQAFVKVGTSGTGGMGLNIPYTHGEEKPSRVLMSKAAVAGAQTMLIFLLARTPDGPSIVKEIKPTTLIGWKEITAGPITRGGQTLSLVDCPVDQAVSLRDPANLASTGSFGQPADGVLEAVYIDTGENGLFAAGEFTAITCLGQMQFVTPEEIAEAVLLEIQGGNTGRDVIAALDSSAMGPTYRAGYLRQAALNRLEQLEAEHGEGVAFEILGPPRLSKLLFEAYLLKRTFKTLPAVCAATPAALSAALAEDVKNTPKLRQQMLTIGIPILLPDGERLLRGPLIKSNTADMGWVDLTPANMAKWQARLLELQRHVKAELTGDTSSFYDRLYPASRMWAPEEIRFDIGEIVGWLFIYEEHGRRMKD
jgi:NAD(P)-dependent dehydrogenase (short-subunit alcohol dehydrogenase family)